MIKKAKEKVKNALDRAIEFIETHLNSYSKLGIAAIGLMLLGFFLLNISKENDPVAGSVMILNKAETGGGTGVILSSSDRESLVLTNAHVCKVVEKVGGLVKGIKGTFMVNKTKVSKEHDLCLIRVSGNLGTNTKIANRAPVEYYEKALISGHPSLLPNVVTSGHFSGRMLIDVIVGFKKCTQEDLDKNPGNGLICMILGGMPIIRKYESTLVTATIMPGSSGSGVYNENKELTALAFAGSRGLGYAWVVPYDAIKSFLEVEQNHIDFESVDNTMSAPSDSHEDSYMDTEFQNSAYKKLSNTCASLSTVDPTVVGTLKKVCKIADRDMLWRE